MPALPLTALLGAHRQVGHEYAPSERARIDQIIAKQLCALECVTTAAPCVPTTEALEAEAPDTVPLPARSRMAVPYVTPPCGDQSAVGSRAG